MKPSRQRVKRLLSFERRGCCFGCLTTWPCAPYWRGDPRTRRSSPAMPIQYIRNLAALVNPWGAARSNVSIRCCAICFPLKRFHNLIVWAHSLQKIKRSPSLLAREQSLRQIANSTYRVHVTSSNDRLSGPDGIPSSVLRSVSESIPQGRGRSRAERPPEPSAAHRR